MGGLSTKMIGSARSPVDSVGRKSQGRTQSLTKRESVGDDPAAEGATAPESLRQKDRFGFCDTLESVHQMWATEGVKLSGIRDRGGRQRRDRWLNLCAEIL